MNCQKHPTISKICKVQVNLAKVLDSLNKLIVYGESKEFTKEHCNINCEELRKLVGHTIDEKQMIK